MSKLIHVGCGGTIITKHGTHKCKRCKRTFKGNLAGWLFRGVLEIPIPAGECDMRLEMES